VETFLKLPSAMPPKTLDERWRGQVETFVEMRAKGVAYDESFLQVAL